MNSRVADGRNPTLWLVIGALSLYAGMRALRRAADLHANALSTTGGIDVQRGLNRSQNAQDSSSLRRQSEQAAHLDIETLQTLISHSNYEIRRAAEEATLRLFESSRYAHRVVQTHLHSRNADEREQAIQVLRTGLAGTNSTFCDFRFNDMDYTLDGPYGQVEPPSFEEIEANSQRLHDSREWLETAGVGGIDTVSDEVAVIDLGDMRDDADPGESAVAFTIQAEGAEDDVETYNRRRRNREAMALGYGDEGLQIRYRDSEDL